MSEPIEVPESAFENKPWFPTFPAPDLVREIKEHIKTKGDPHLWWGHTHTTPPMGGRIVYLDEFDVPTFGVTMDRVAPCPCCTPRHRKYKSGGKIAWFPDEAVIRLIGPQCYKSLDAEGHELAEHEFRERQRREKYARYLITQLPLLPEIVRTGDEVLEMAKAADEFRETLQRRLANTLFLRLWENVRNGVLNLIVRTREIRAGADGDHQMRTVDKHERYATIEGWEVLDPRATKIAPTLKRNIDRLQVMRFELGQKQDVRDADDLTLRRAAQTMANARKVIAAAIDRIALERKIVSPMTVATLRTWGQLDAATLKFSLRRNGRDLLVGRDRDHCCPIRIPPEMERTLPVLPHLADE